MRSAVRKAGILGTVEIALQPFFARRKTAEQLSGGAAEQWSRQGGTDEETFDHRLNCGLLFT
jgi:hypothetical protein